MHPSIETRVLSSQARQKSGHDKTAKEQLLKVGDQVYVRNFASGAKWLPGVITTVRGNQSYDISLEDG